MSALELRRAVIDRELSPVEIVKNALRRLDTIEPEINAFVTPTPELALAAAAKAEQAVMRNERLGLLHGLPVSVKDVTPVADIRCTFGSKLAADNVAGVDAAAVERLKSQFACIIGKTTTSEFGCKAVGDSPLTGITRNPWDTSKTPGGSSCGAAASVAAGVTPFALGTDGGGSIRIPAALCGLFGIKAQFGRVPMFPTSAAPTLTHVAPMARTVRDAALLLMAIAGYDSRDPFSITEPVPDYLAACDRSPSGLKIAWSPTLGYARPEPEVVRIAEAAVKSLQDAGCIVEQIDRVMDDPCDIWMSEFYASIGTRLQGFPEEKQRLLDPAVARVLAGALDQSLKQYYTTVFRRYEFREQMRQFFMRYDLLASPTLPVASVNVGCDIPPGLGDRNIVSWVYYTYPFNLTGQPAASVPAGLTVTGFPVGLQLVSRAHHESDLFRAAAALEIIRPWRNPKLEIGQ